jgi:hypothetical protein
MSTGEQRCIISIPIKSMHDSMYGIVWAKTHKTFPWWPCMICDPSYLIKDEVRKKGLSAALKGKYTLFCFGEGTYDFANPTQFVPFMDNYKKHSQQNVSTRVSCSNY